MTGKFLVLNDDTGTVVESFSQESAARAWVESKPTNVKSYLIVKVVAENKAVRSWS